MTDQAPQYRVSTTIDGNHIDDRALDDPFVRHTITIAPEDLRDAYLDDRPLVVVVHVDGTRAGVAHVMQPIRPEILALNDQQPERITGVEALEVRA